jgi:hypothetical protein
MLSSAATAAVIRNDLRSARSFRDRLDIQRRIMDR